MNAQKPFFADYDGQSLDDLLALEGEYRLGSLVTAVEQALGVKAWRQGDTALSDAESIVLAVEALRREVNNGGYWQFFAGSSSEFVHGIVAALRRIDCPVIADATVLAMQAFGVSESMSADEVMSTVAEVEVADQAALNTAYFTSGEDLTQQLFDFIKQNRESIRIP